MAGQKVGGSRHDEDKYVFIARYKPQDLVISLDSSSVGLLMSIELIYFNQIDLCYTKEQRHILKQLINCSIAKPIRLTSPSQAQTTSTAHPTSFLSLTLLLRSFIQLIHIPLILDPVTATTRPTTRKRPTIQQLRHPTLPTTTVPHIVPCGTLLSALNVHIL